MYEAIKVQKLKIHFVKRISKKRRNYIKDRYITLNSKRLFRISKTLRELRNLIKIDTKRRYVCA